MDRADRRQDHVPAADARHFGLRLAADGGPHLRDISSGRARARAGGRFLHRRHRLCLALVREGAPGDGARHLRRRQRRCRSDELRRSLPGGGARLAGHGARLRHRARHHGDPVLPSQQGRSGNGRTQEDRCTPGLCGPATRSAEEHSGLAVRNLLLLRLRRLRRPRVLPAALLCRRLRTAADDRGRARRPLFAAGLGLPGSGRLVLRPLRRTLGHVPDVLRIARLPVRDELSAHELRRHRHPRDGRLFLRHRARRLRLPDHRARLRHEPRQGGRLQAHPRLLPGPCRRGRRPRRHDRRARRLLPADLFRRTPRPDGHLDGPVHADVHARRRLDAVDARRHPPDGEAPSPRAGSRAVSLRRAGPAGARTRAGGGNRIRSRRSPARSQDHAEA